MCAELFPTVPAADDAFIRASTGILMSRNMPVKDRVEAADSLARYEPRAAVPILIEALNETSEPVRRAAARGLWTIAQSDTIDVVDSARAAMPALRVALADSSVSVAMNAAGALERLGEPTAVLADVRRRALRTAGTLGLRALPRRAGAHRDRSGAKADTLRARVALCRAPARGYVQQPRRARQHSDRQCHVGAVGPLRRPWRADDPRSRVARRAARDRRSASCDGGGQAAARSLRADPRRASGRAERRHRRNRLRVDAGAGRPGRDRSVGPRGRARPRRRAPPGSGRARAACHRGQDCPGDARSRSPRGKQRPGSGSSDRARDARRGERRHEDVEWRSPSGSTALDYAKAACPEEVQQALLGRIVAK